MTTRSSTPPFDVAARVCDETRCRMASDDGGLISAGTRHVTEESASLQRADLEALFRQLVA